VNSLGKFDIVLGNPPWGSIDSKKVLNDNEVKESLKKYAVYKDKTDLCIYVFERAFGLLSKNGRIGMVCKLQTTNGKQHKKFIEWWKVF
jgi:tRNA1(Val) A37 N6-methylase TrmN6